MLCLGHSKNSIMLAITIIIISSSILMAQLYNKSGNGKLFWHIKVSVIFGTVLTYPKCRPNEDELDCKEAKKQTDPDHLMRVEIFSFLSKQTVTVCASSENKTKKKKVADENSAYLSKAHWFVKKPSSLESLSSHPTRTIKAWFPRGLGCKMSSVTTHLEGGSSPMNHRKQGLLTYKLT